MIIINNNLTLKILTNIYNRRTNIKSTLSQRYKYGLSIYKIFRNPIRLNRYNNGIPSKIKYNSNNNDSLKNNIRIC